MQQIHRMISFKGIHGSRQRINNKSIQDSYLVHYRAYQGAKKGKQVASSTKWGLRDSVVLRLVECLTPTVSFVLFMDCYFSSFRLFIWLRTLELTPFK